MNLKSRLRALEAYRPIDTKARDIAATRARCMMILQFCDPDDTTQIERCKRTIAEIDAGTYQVEPMPVDMDARAAAMRERMIKDLRGVEA